MTNLIKPICLSLGLVVSSSMVLAEETDVSPSEESIVEAEQTAVAAEAPENGENQTAEAQDSASIEGNPEADAYEPEELEEDLVSEVQANPKDIFKQAYADFKDESGEIAAAGVFCFEYLSL